MSEQIIFTDRYGGHPPSALRGCFGDCEAMGVYPYKVDTTLNLSGKFVMAYPDGINREFKIDADGYAWVMCPSCMGTGRISWWHTICRIPSWWMKGARFICDAWKIKADHFTWPTHAWLLVKCAWLYDLGWPR